MFLQRTRKCGVAVSRGAPSVRAMSEKVTSGISRRNALIALGASGVAASGATLIGEPAQASSPLLLAKPERLGAPPVEGLHLTFGADPATQMVVSWTTDRDVARPRVSYGTLEGGHGRVV